MVRENVDLEIEEGEGKIYSGRGLINNREEMRGATMHRPIA